MMRMVVMGRKREWMGGAGTDKWCRGGWKGSRCCAVGSWRFQARRCWDPRLRGFGWQERVWQQMQWQHALPTLLLHLILNMIIQLSFCGPIGCRPPISLAQAKRLVGPCQITVVQPNHPVQDQPPAGLQRYNLFHTC